MTMNQHIKAKWLDALRSGKYEQGTEVLQNHNQGRFCCLGVLCDIAVNEGVAKVHVQDHTHVVVYSDMEGHCSTEHLPIGVAAWAGVTTDPDIETFDPDECELGERHLNGSCRCGETATLSELNDRGYSFRQIAEYIEEQL